MNNEIENLPQNSRLICTELLSNADKQCDIENKLNHNPKYRYIWHKEKWPIGFNFPEKYCARIYCIEN